MSNEEWRDIRGYPGYQASSLGRVRSLDRTVKCKGGTRVHKGKTLKLSVHPNGYLLCAPCVNGKAHNTHVHRLVMLAFVGPLPAGCWTAHNDGNPANNALSNLRYDTVSSNHKDKHAHGTVLAGERVGSAKLTAQDVLQIRALRAAGEPIPALVEKFNVSKANISRICRGAMWSHVGGPLTQDYFRSKDSAIKAGVDPDAARIFPFRSNHIGAPHARPSV